MTSSFIKSNQPIPVIVRCMNCHLDIEGYQHNGAFYGFIEKEGGYMCDSCEGFRTRANENLLKYSLPKITLDNITPIKTTLHIPVIHLSLSPDRKQINILSDGKETKDSLAPAAAPPVSPYNEPDKDIDFLLGIAEECEDIVLFDGFDKALIGIGGADGAEVAVYDVNKVIEILMYRDGINYEGANEYFRHNIAGCHIGKATPIFVDYTDLGCLKTTCKCKVK